MTNQFDADVRIEKHGGEECIFLYVKNFNQWSALQINEGIDGLKLLGRVIEEKIKELENAD